MIDEQEQFSRALAALGITDVVGDLRREIHLLRHEDMRDVRNDVSDMRSELTTTRLAVARIEGRQESDSQHTETSWRWRSTLVEVAAAAGVLLGAFAALTH